MLTSRPLVSILVNNWNYAEFLPHAIESALEQTYSPIEVIVTDDGSTDHSRDVILSFGEQIRSVFKANGGQASAINAGYGASRGDIIALLDADDLFESAKIAQVVEAFASGTAIGWVFHGMTPFTRTGDLPPYGPDREGAEDHRRAVVRGKLNLITAATSSLCFRRALLDRILPMPEACGVEISDAYLRIAAIGLSPGFCITAPLSRQRLHAHNLFTGTADQHAQQARILARTGHELRRRFPQLRKMANKLLSSSSFESYLGGTQSDPSYRRLLLEALQECSRLERISIAARAHFHTLRSRL